MKWEPQTVYPEYRAYAVQRYTARFLADPESAPSALWRSRARAAHHHYARGLTIVVATLDGRELARIDPRRDGPDGLKNWRG